MPHLTPVTMLSFGNDPHSNRLRQTERTGEVLLRRICETEPSFSGPATGEASPQDDLVEEEDALMEHHIHENGMDHVNNINMNNMNGNVMGSRLPPHMVPSTSRQDLHESDDDEEEMAMMFKKTSYLVPSKSQVLYYLSSSSNFKIVRSGSDLQITDSADFPLMDVWAERSCCVSDVWIVESYGRRVMVMSEASSSTSSWSPFSRSSSSTPQAVTDWNGDLVGFVLPGNPFVIQNSNRATIARGTSAEPDDRNHDNWVCILEGCEREVARVERSALRFVPEIGFQLKLLVLAAFSRALASTNQRQPMCWPFWSR